MLFILLLLRKYRILEVSSDEYDTFFKIEAAVSKNLAESSENQNRKLFEFNKLIGLSRLRYKPNKKIDVKFDIKMIARSGSRTLFEDIVEIYDERGVDAAIDPVYVKEIEIEVDGDESIGEISFYKNDELLNEISNLFEDYTYTSITKRRNVSRVLDLYEHHPTKNIFSSKINYSGARLE